MKRTVVERRKGSSSLYAETSEILGLRCRGRCHSLNFITTSVRTVGDRRRSGEGGQGSSRGRWSRGKVGLEEEG